MGILAKFEFELEHRGILVTMQKQPLSEVAAVADSAHEELGPHIGHINAIKTDKLGELQKAIQEIREDIKFLKRKIFNDGNGRDDNRRYRSQSRGRPQVRQPQEGVCFYHTNYGAEAKKCTPPCKFPKN